MKSVFDNDIFHKKELGTIFVQDLLTLFLQHRFNWWVIRHAFQAFGRKIDFLTNIIQLEYMLFMSLGEKSDYLLIVETMLK